MFPVGDRYLRFSFGGACGPGESWVSGIDAVFEGLGAGAGTPSEAEVNAAAFLTLVTAQLWGSSSSMKPHNSAGVTLNSAQCSIYAGSAGGALVFQASGVAAQADVVGTGTANAMPFDQALCATMITQLGTRSGRGRRFLPCSSATLDSTDHQLADAVCIDLVNGWVNLIDGIVGSAWLAGGVSASATPAVLSLTQQTASAITTVRADSIMDSWRARKRSAVPNFIERADV